MIKGIVFDFDGTLSSEREYIYGCYQAISQVLENHFGIFDSFEKMVRLFEKSQERIFNRLLEAEGIVYTEDDIQYLVAKYREAEPVTRLYEDAIPALERAGQLDLKRFILTNGYEKIQRKKIQNAHMEHFTEEIIIPDEFGRAFWKPDSRCLESILEKHAVNRKEIIIVGDGLSDARLAEKMNVPFFLIDREDKVTQAYARFKGDHFADGNFL